MNTLIKIDELKKQINERHDSIQTALKRSVQEAIAIGGLLIQVKEQLQHGEFGEWINQNCNFTDRTARNYIQIFKYKNKMETISDLQEAYKQIEYYEQQEKKKITEEREKKMSEYKKTGIKPDNWTRSDDYNYKKYYDDKERDKRIAEFKQKKEQERIEREKQNRADDERIKENETIIEQLTKNINEQKEFVNRINEGNKYQDTFFSIIHNYINELKTDSEKLEALNNIIKYCKELAIKYQQKSIT